MSGCKYSPRLRVFLQCEVVRIKNEEAYPTLPGVSTGWPFQ